MHYQTEIQAYEKQASDINRSPGPCQPLHEVQFDIDHHMQVEAEIQHQ